MLHNVTQEKRTDIMLAPEKISTSRWKCYTAGKENAFDGFHYKEV